LYDPIQAQTEFPFFQGTRASVMAVSDRAHITNPAFSKFGGESRSYFVDMKVWTPAEMTACVKMFIEAQADNVQVEMIAMLSTTNIKKLIFFFRGTARILHFLFNVVENALGTGSADQNLAKFDTSFTALLDSQIENVRLAHDSLTTSFSTRAFYDRVRMNGSDVSKDKPLTNQLFTPVCNSHQVKKFRYVYTFSSPLAATLYYSRLVGRATSTFLDQLSTTPLSNPSAAGLVFKDVMPLIAHIGQLCTLVDVAALNQLRTSVNGDTDGNTDSENITTISTSSAMNKFLRHADSFFSIRPFKGEAMLENKYVPVAVDNFMPSVSGSHDLALNTYLQRLSEYARSPDKAAEWAGRVGATFVKFPDNMKDFDGCCIMPRKQAPNSVDDTITFDVVLLQITSSAKKTYTMSQVDAIDTWRAHEAASPTPSVMCPLGTCYVVPSEQPFSVHQEADRSEFLFKYPVSIASVSVIDMSAVWYDALFGKLLPIERISEIPSTEASSDASSHKYLL
jgi:hypothetical protein